MSSAQVMGVIAPHPPIIVPQVGGSRSQVTAATLSALDEAGAALAHYDPETLVVMSPHAPLVADGIAVDDSQVMEGSLAQFGDSTLQSWSGDPALAHALVTELTRLGVSAVSRSGDARLRPGWLDHGVLVPLHFLDPTRRFKIVVISLSFRPYAEHRAIGQALGIAAAATGRRVAFIASGDLSHRLTPDAPAGYSARAHELDDAIVGLVRQGMLAQLADIEPSLIETGGECGLRSFIALSGFAGDDPVPTRVLSYEGPWGVGYLTALVGQSALEQGGAAGDIGESTGRKGGAAGADDSDVVRLARRAIESFVRDSTELSDPILPAEEYPARAGAFVSLHREGKLRGCIGTILPVQPTLAEEVAHNAVEAAVRDPRFPRMSPSELADLEIKVDVLHAPESCTLADLDPTRYGVIATSGWRRGLLLPDLEGVDDVETQVAIATQKAGIMPGEPCSYERFRVDRYT